MAEWRAVAGYEGLYEVSSEGGVRSLDRPYVHNLWGKVVIRRGVTLRPTVGKDGHLRVRLSRDGKSSVRFVHRLVAGAFIPNPDELPWVLHWNDVPDDNHVDNLRWGTPSDNRYDTVRNGSHSNANKTHCPQGHEYTPDNTRLSSRGQRHCRTCARISQRDRRKNLAHQS